MDECITEEHFDSILHLERAYVDTSLRKIEVAMDKRIHEMASRLRSDITAELLQRVLVGEGSMSKKLEACENSISKKLETSHQLQKKSTNEACRRLDGKLSDIQNINGSLTKKDRAIALSQDQQIKETEMSIARLQIEMDAVKVDLFMQVSRCTDPSPTPKMPCIVSAKSVLEDWSQFASLCSRVTALEKQEQVALSSSADESSLYDVPAPTDCAQCVDNSDVSTADSGAGITAPHRSSVEAIHGDMECLEHETMAESLDRQTACASVSGSDKNVQNLEHGSLSWREKLPVAALTFLEPCSEAASLEPCELCPPLGSVESTIIACASPSRPSHRGRQVHQMPNSPTKTPISYCFPKDEQDSEEIEEFLKGIARDKSPL